MGRFFSFTRILITAKKQKKSKFNDEVQQAALERVNEELTFVRTLTSGPRRKWRRWYNIVRLFRIEGLNTYNRVFVPRGWEQVEKIAPRLTAHDPSYEPIPTVPSAIPFISYVAEWLSYMWEERNLRKNTRDMVQGGLIFGTDFVKMEMDSITRKELIETKETQLNPETGQLEEVQIEEEVEISSLPTFNSVDIFDIDIDPRYGTIEAAPGIIHTREHVRYAELLRDAKDLGYINLKDVKELAVAQAPDNFDNSKELKLQARDIPTGSGSPDQSNKPKDNGGINLNDLTVREYWGVFSPSGKVEDEEEYVITTVNDSMVIRLERNPYATKGNADGIRPFEVYVDHAVKGELYGIGEIEPTETLQVALNKMRNHRLDNVDLVLNRMWVYDRNAGINPKHLRSFPGNVIPADDINGIQPLPTPDVTSSSYNDEDRIERDFQRATGNIDGADAGGANSFTNTATGEKIRDKDRTSRFQLKIENLEDTLARIGKKMLKMLAATEGSSFVIRRKNESGQAKFTEIQKSVLDQAVQNMEFKVKSGSTISDDWADRRNDAIAQWNMAVAASDKQIITPGQLKQVWTDMMRIAFQHQGLVDMKGGGLESLMPQMPGTMPGGQPTGNAPGGSTAGQLNPSTMTPNGLPPLMAMGGGSPASGPMPQR